MYERQFGHLISFANPVERSGRSRRFPLLPPSGEGRLTEPTAGVHPGARAAEPRQHLLAREQGTSQLYPRLRVAWARRLRFLAGVIAQARSSSQEVHNASVAIVDETFGTVATDRPRFPAAAIPDVENDPRTRHRGSDEHGTLYLRDRHPAEFRPRVLAGASQRSVNVDATAMVQAGLGAGYAQQIITTEVANFVSKG